MNTTNHADLDRPAWAALTTHQAHLGFGDALARRFHADVAPFAALASWTPDAYDALARLLGPDEQVALQSFESLEPVEGMQMTRLGMLDQMVDTRAEVVKADNEIVRLSAADAPAMLDLVQKTQPGPFAKRTYEMGNYIGIREGTRLIAMAGERMHMNGYVEISAVCVDDAYRGRGIAGRLINVLRGEIRGRGETPFLHVLSNNTSAIGLYERLGFELRRAFHLTRIKRAG